MKKYTPVNVLTEPDEFGNATPTDILWTNNKRYHIQRIIQVCQPEDKATDGAGHPDENPYIQDNPGLVRTPVGAVMVLAQQNDHPRPADENTSHPHPHTPALLQPVPQHELQKEENRGQRPP